MKCFYLAMQMDMKFGQFHQGKNQTNLITILSCILIRKEPHGAFLKALAGQDAKEWLFERSVDSL